MANLHKEVKKVFVIALLVCLLSVPASLATATDWTYFATDDQGGELYYDRENITNAHNIIKIYQREVYSEKQIGRIKDIMGDSYTDITESVKLIFIDCEQKLSKFNISALYNSAGEAITGSIHENTVWKAILRNTADGLLYELCCPAEWMLVTSSEDAKYFLNIDRITVDASKVTFWMKGVDKKNGEEMEKYWITIQCRDQTYSIRYHASYETGRKTPRIFSPLGPGELKDIRHDTVVDAFYDLLCRNGAARIGLEAYLEKEKKETSPVQETAR